MVIHSLCVLNVMYIHFTADGILQHCFPVKLENGNLTSSKRLYQALDKFPIQKLKSVSRVSKGNERREKLSCPCKRHEVMQNRVNKS